MKIRILLITLLLGAVVFLHAQYALVDFMYVPEDGDETYLQMEENYAKPVHQELINQGKLTYWGLYRVAYPGGTGAEYQYVTVRIYSDMEQLAHSNEFNSTFEKVHEGEIIEAIYATVVNTRDLVKTYRFHQWGAFMDPNLTEQPKILQVVYFNVDLPKWDDYVEMETKIFHPMHKKEIEMGNRAGWQGYQLTGPMGSSIPYTHVAVDLYKDWAQYTKPVDSEAIRKAVHPNKKQSEIDELFFETTHLYRIEEWQLIDFVAKEN